MKTNVGSIGIVGFAPMVVCWLALSLSGVFDASAQSGVTTIQYQEDVSFGGTYQHLGAELRGSLPNHNSGGEPLIRTGGSGDLRTALAFDLTGITSDMIITSIRLQMHADSIEGGSPFVEIHRVQHATHSMIEGAFSGAPFSEGGPDPVGVTWNRVQNDGSSDILWATPGGDFSATVLSSVTVTSGGASYLFASSSAFEAAAQDALVNNGGLLELILTSPSSAFVRWNSDDATTAGFRPLLEVSYVPEPTATALLGLGGLVLLRRRQS
jgi:hypothetical protein